MQGKHLFEYAVVRFVPKVEREEFMNVGVILYCAEQNFLKVLFCVDEVRLGVFNADLETDELRANLLAFERICLGANGSGPIGCMDIASRFRWLTATRSTVLQTSKVHPGFCIDAGTTLNKLYHQLVLLP